MNFRSALLGLILVAILLAKIELVNSSTEGLTIQFTLDKYALDTTMIHGHMCSRISLATSMNQLSQVGAPELPYVLTNIALPSHASVTVEVSDVVSEELEVAPVIPSKGILSRSTDPATVAYTFGDSYRANQNFPTTLTSLSAPFILREVRGVTLKIFPFQYNGATKKLTIVKSATIKIREIPATAKETRNAREPLLKTQSKSFEHLYASTFINYQSPKNRSQTASSEKLIIITGATSDTTGTLKDAVLPLARWKIRKGIATEIYQFPTETSENADITPQALQAFIASKYHEGATHFLLVGDDSNLPTLQSDNVYGKEPGHGGYMDPLFGMIDGDDFYQDAFIGRITTETFSTTKIVVDKIINYEKYPQLGASWYTRGVGVAADEGMPEDWTWMNLSRDTMLAHSYTEVDSVYDALGSLRKPEDLIPFINSGVSLINYMGHGNADVWGTTRLSNTHINNDLTNGAKLPIIVSVACLVGGWEWDDCFAETWINKEGGGAIAFLGSSTSQPRNPPIVAQQKIVQSLAGNTFSSLGEIFANGMIGMVSAADTTYGDSIQNPNYGAAVTWTTFGDPTLTPFNDVPTQLVLHHPLKASATYTVTGEDGVQVTIYNPTENKMLSKEIAGGSVTFDISDFKTDTVFVTGTKTNRAPYLGMFGDHITPITPLQATHIAPLAIQSISARTLSLSVPSTGVYTIKYYSINGRLLSSRTQRLTAGTHTLARTKSLSPGVVIVRVLSATHSLSQRLVVR